MDGDFVFLLILKAKDAAFNGNINQNLRVRINPVNCADKYSILNMTGS